MGYWEVYEFRGIGREVLDFTISVVVLGVSLSWRYILARRWDFAVGIFIAIGIGFLFHELSHRLIAKRFGAFARYKAWYLGLLMALVISVASRGSIVFAAPGAVEVYLPWYIPRAELLISLAGPFTNLVIAIISTIVKLFISEDPISIYVYAIGYVNTILAFFNLLPISPLDGFKILRRNVFAWIALLIISTLLLIHYL